ncbi:hypothetical protein NEDG_00337 [Nematocida displodere]|uniref:Uncharacterized protein n=1 Tax=Nematocida displodere TaxID=1805483 RepID=A0A177EL85_9MICR|nr:hypothetical protein NEDG_00337 [Nematocida displodere]
MLERASDKSASELAASIRAAVEHTIYAVIDNKAIPKIQDFIQQHSIPIRTDPNKTILVLTGTSEHTYTLKHQLTTQLFDSTPTSFHNPKTNPKRPRPNNHTPKRAKPSQTQPNPTRT